MDSFALSFSLVRRLGRWPAQRWLPVLALLAGLVRPALAQDPQLPARKSGLERAPLQTEQLAEVQPVDTAKVFSLQDLADLVFVSSVSSAPTSSIIFDLADLVSVVFILPSNSNRWWARATALVEVSFAPMACLSRLWW